MQNYNKKPVQKKDNYSQGPGRFHNYEAAIDVAQGNKYTNTGEQKNLRPKDSLTNQSAMEMKRHQDFSYQHAGQKSQQRDTSVSNIGKGAYLAG